MLSVYELNHNSNSRIWSATKHSSGNSSSSNSSDSSGGNNNNNCSCNIGRHVHVVDNIYI